MSSACFSFAAIFVFRPARRPSFCWSVWSESPHTPLAATADFVRPSMSALNMANDSGVFPLSIASGTSLSNHVGRFA